MAKVYHSVNIKVASAQYDMISAMLSQFPFESFYETEDALIGYFSDDMDVQEMTTYLDRIKSTQNLSYSIETIQETNWNAEWESNFDPIYVDNFVCVRADFHEVPEKIVHDILINPKMSFGTGHHETTYMMMEAMRKIDHAGLKVLDLGCGTSILAILAEKMGAKEVFAIDYDEKCVVNSEENIAANMTEQITIALGTIDDVADNDYDLVLANINRSVLLSSAEKLYDRMVDQGQILLSGILKVDEDLVREKFVTSGFSFVSLNQRGEWLCMLLKCEKAS